MAVSVAACAVYFRIQRARMRRELGSDAVLGRFRTEVSELITEMNAITERNVALLESRIGEAAGIIEKAGKAASVLKGEAEALDRAGSTYSSLSRARPISISVDDAVPDNAPPPPPPEPDPVDFESLSVRDKALVLYRRGEGPDSIAGKLGMSRGEVELIISLHDRRR